MMQSTIRASVAACLLASAASAGSLPEGSFKGSSPLVSAPDVMALLVRNDPGRPNVQYAVLAEYTRVPFIPGPERIELTRWVPRVYAYRVAPLDKLKYAMMPLRVSEAGELVLDGSYLTYGVLALAKKGTLDGATLTRYDKGSALAAETVAFKGKLSSTWEDYVPGNFFGSKDSTGGDYLKKDVNMTLSKDKVAEFSQKDIKGKFDVVQKAPGMFTFRPQSKDNVGVEKVAPMIGVFIDIVNWKPIMTTDELLLINPDNPKDVGFYYERH